MNVPLSGIKHNRQKSLKSLNFIFVVTTENRICYNRFAYSNLNLNSKCNSTENAFDATRFNFGSGLRLLHNCEIILAILFWRKYIHTSSNLREITQQKPFLTNKTNLTFRLQDISFVFNFWQSAGILFNGFDSIMIYVKQNKQFTNARFDAVMLSLMLMLMVVVQCDWFDEMTILMFVRQNRISNKSSHLCGHLA